MGKRKGKAKAPPKKKMATVQKVFDCPFCAHKLSVTCVLDQSTMIGKIQCGVCHTSWQTRIHNLSAPIDVFSEWIDKAAERDAEEEEDRIDDFVVEAPERDSGAEEEPKEEEEDESEQGNESD